MNIIDDLKQKRIATDYDIDRVARVVAEYPQVPFFILIEKMHRIFKEVTPVQYMIAGFLTGYRESAKNTDLTLQNYNAWIRQN